MYQYFAQYLANMMDYKLHVTEEHGGYRYALYKDGRVVGFSMSASGNLSTRISIYNAYLQRTGSVYNLSSMRRNVTDFDMFSIGVLAVTLKHCLMSPKCYLLTKHLRPYTRKNVAFDHSCLYSLIRYRSNIRFNVDVLEREHWIVLARMLALTVPIRTLFRTKAQIRKDVMAYFER
jgi:hypothetical protein